ncbi:MAG: hypothetical protein WB785_15025 [Mycobacterium sp.]
MNPTPNVAKDSNVPTKGAFDRKERGGKDQGGGGAVDEKSYHSMQATVLE